ncbi:roadblock/LC7 domain-containing protein [Kibdelosporangium aridum]|uniref:Predicted regulator of Ras-like GTPase activity, Roadblock/LC7/MglB family n=1 Tax=Kibdelosporangium aridum TaxID=2030 RepID=A0A1W2FRW6_KIBAR|nr:roadblock/LC7 domain-containing protein [Kibdelosporangium aridum]SMD24660.1 Predicted regulator of Ras-like GTPase activity, Roadblock/LC7/MglB family [Kibdelosporangium aridum]
MTERVQYLLQNLLTADGVPGLQMVMAVTVDGMLRAHAYRDQDTANRAAAERLAAGTASLVALAGSVLAEQGDVLRQLPIEGRQSWYVVIAAGPHAYLAARADHDAVLDDVFYALHRIVGSVGQELTATLRDADAPAWVPTGSPER